MDTQWIFLFLAILATAKTEELCSARETVEVVENNAVGDLVETIILAEGVTASLIEPTGSFILIGDRLLANEVLDFETSQTHVVRVRCGKDDPNISPLSRVIVVIVLNVNDNPPVFDKNTYQIGVNELLREGTLLDTFPATDRDPDTTLYYTLTSATDYFRLQSSENPQLVINNIMDYDKVQNVQLVLRAQDTPLSGSDGEVSFTGTATIEVTVLDVDNRPPWFIPCKKYEVAGAVICQNTGYSSMVKLNEMQTEPLTLTPFPLHAIDGDVGINEAIKYSFLGAGNEDGLFQINENTGDINVLRAVDVLGNISLTILAAQTPTSSQFATTSLTISVVVQSNHKPKFERPSYQSVVSSVGAMATDPDNDDEPLQIVALDEDYASMEGKNPHIVYRIIGSNDFSIIQGYLFMTKDLPDDTLSLQVEAEDTSNKEKATAELSVKVKMGQTTTALPLSTTESVTSFPTTDGRTTAEATSDPATTAEIRTTEPTKSTTNPTTESSTSTVIPTISESVTSATTESWMTSMFTDSPTSTAEPDTEKVPIPPGTFGPMDMAALGATLGVLLFICVVVIGVLACRLQKGKADWEKIHEASIFRSSLGQDLGGEKQGIQYTNEAFQHDDDDDSVGPGSPYVTKVEEGPSDNLVFKSNVTALGSLLEGDDISQTSSDKDKEVKPILTKERRLEEGYKAVWFKKDIDPNAKEEVVIIPDRREVDSEDEDEDGPAKPSKVAFTESDMDSGLGVKLEEAAEDSDGDNNLKFNL
ncbi:cadherin-related family member 5-like isoform X1 [Stigmatopora nigra]